MKRPLTFNQKVTRHKSAISPVVAALIVAVLLIAAFAGYIATNGFTNFSGQQNNVAPKNPNAPQTTATVQQSQCVSSTPQATTYMASHYSSDSTISNLQWNQFVSNGNQQLVASQPSPGSVTDGTQTTAAGSFSIGAPASGLSIQGPTWEQVTQSSSPNAYPMWIGPLSASILTNPITQFGQTVFSVSCSGSSSNSAVSNWNQYATLFEAPSSGTSATTNTALTLVPPGGASAPTAWPTTATTYTLQLNVYQAYKAAGLAYPECGTQADPVTNYATGQTYYGCPQGPGQGGLPTAGLVGIIAVNATAISISVGSGYTLTAISGLPTGVKAYTITANGQGYINGCAPAPSSGVSSSNAYACVQIPITMYETKSQGSSTASACFIMADFQQASYVQQNFNVPSATTYHSTHWCQSATGSFAGLPTNFTTLTPTGSINAGNPAPLIEQGYTLDSLTY